MTTRLIHKRRVTDEHHFLLQRVQPAMVGLIDGSLSTLAPIFSVALISHKPFYAFIAGLATSIGAGISMAFSEGLSDTGELTGRGSPMIRGGITGIGTFIGRRQRLLVLRQPLLGLRRRLLVGLLLILEERRRRGLEDERRIDELEVGHLGRVARARPDARDAQVAARPLGERRADLGDEL